MTDTPTPAHGRRAAGGDGRGHWARKRPTSFESAAELGLGAVIAPFTGGETVNIVGSVASMFEAGVDRLTHLGEHETERESPPELDEDGRPIRPVPDTDIPTDPGNAPDDGRE